MIYILAISIYILLSLFVVIGFFSYPYSNKERGLPLSVTIIMAARNEEENIQRCLASIASQEFPKELLEIIVVDDNSSDGTHEKAQTLLQSLSIKHQVIRNVSHLGKKESIRKAIELSSNELIITRDADTFTVSNEWLRSIVDYQSISKKEFIICPVAIENNKALLGSLQEMETAVLTLFTVSSTYYKVPFLCSGANLAFTKSLFYKTKAYESHLHIQSGDDVFFLEEVKKVDLNSIAFLKNKNVIVYTYPEKGMKSLVRQKVRWSSKVFKSSSVLNWLTAAIMALINFLWLWALFYEVFGQQNPVIGLFFVLSKLLIDILLVFLASSFVKVKANSALVLFMGCLYPLYASVIVLLATLMKPKWKSN